VILFFLFKKGKDKARWISIEFWWNRSQTKLDYYPDNHELNDEERDDDNSS
jgi:hypothetical protein